MKQAKIFLIVWLFVLSILSHGYSKEQIPKESLKQIRGQAGVFIELEDIFIKFKYEELTYTDTDGYGSSTSAGIKIKYDDNFQTLEFKPIKEHQTYSNENLKNIFGNSIENVGLTKKNQQAQSGVPEKINTSKELLIPLSNLSIHTLSLCSTLTLINLYNKGLLSSFNNLDTQEIINSSQAIGGIKVELPSIESKFGKRQNDIILFNATSDSGIRNNNKILFSIEWGESKTAILGGKIEITPNQ